MTAPALELRRIDAARNMRRFYRLDMQPDLFGGVLLVRQWGASKPRDLTISVPKPI
jgi:predicted DNA-binding WGR domain protein